MVYESLGAAQILEEKYGLSIGVMDVHTIKPLDKNLIDQLCADYDLMVTVEELNIIGGLGSAVAEAKAAKVGAPPQISLGLPDEYGHGGLYRDLLESNGLTALKLADRIRVEYNNLTT